MPKSRKKKTPKRVLALPDLEQAKSTVLNSLSSASGQRTYDHAIDEFVRRYCSEPRLALTGPSFCATASIWNSASTRRQPSTSVWSPCVASPTRPPMRVCSVRSWLRVSGASRVYAALACAWETG